MRNTFKVEPAKKNITQQDLAEAVGVSRQTINSIESQKHTSSTVLSLKIAHIFETTVDAVFELEEDDYL